jgi:cold shock CspA family protein
MQQFEGVFTGWIEGRRYCFIMPDGGSPKVFLHMDDVPSQTPLRVGTRLTFRVETSPKGQRAYEVRILSASVQKCP